MKIKNKYVLRRVTRTVLLNGFPNHADDLYANIFYVEFTAITRNYRVDRKIVLLPTIIIINSTALLHQNKPFSKRFHFEIADLSEFIHKVKTLMRRTRSSHV